MIFTTAFTVFALGLRHGADPDHLAAIDNMTRNSATVNRRLARFVGAIFAGGHTVMVLAIAALVGFLGAHFSGHADTIERIGTWISIAVLILIAAMNVRQLMLGRTDRVAGYKTGLLPSVLRNARSPWVALPVGLLFGFGFETSSQVAAYVMAFGAQSGILGALIVGGMFCLGMIVTDTLDSLMVYRIVSYRLGTLPRVMRVWIVSVTVFAVAVAAYELASVLGIKLPLTDLGVSGILVLSLLAVFFWVFTSTRVRRDDAILEQVQ